MPVNSMLAYGGKLTPECPELAGVGVGFVECFFECVGLVFF